MRSAAKAITAGVVAVAIGGALIIAEPFQQQSGVVAAEVEPIAPTWITGDIGAAPSCTSDPDVMDGDVRRSRNIECSPQVWTSTDPRLTGEVVRRWNEDVYQTDEGPIAVSMDGAYLRNDGGGWACSASQLLKGSGSSSEEVTGTTHTCTGDGGYEGLSALLSSEQGPAPSYSAEFVGLIFAGDFPPLPEPPADE